MQPGDRAANLAARAAMASPDPLLLVTESGEVVFANGAARMLFGERVQADPVESLLIVPGPPIHHLIGGNDVARLATAVTQGGDRIEVDIVIGPSDEGIAAIAVRRRDEPGVSTIELLRRATHDDMTQLANRASFVERVTRDTAGRDNVGHALIMVDLDGFKQVNDGFGHEVGDQVLIEVARRLRRACRPDDLVARIGGDEFALWCPGVRDASVVRPLVHRILEAIEEPIPIASSQAVISASVGVVVTDTEMIDTAELLAKADAAMYRAKGLGRGNHMLYDESLGRDLVRTRRLERSLGRAIGADELMLHYQAIVDAVTLDPVGVESLIRWPHPQLGLIEPAELIEVAARTHLHTSMTNWVLDAAIAQLVRWNRVLPEPLRISVNVATSQLTEAFVDHVVSVLDVHGVEAARLTIEVTEDIMAPRRRDGLALLERLHGLGIRLAIDDFGTGGAALSGLQDLPVHALKIDPVLIAGVAGSKRQASIVEAIIGLAHALGLDVVAEGIENEEDLRTVRELGCDLVQGFFVAAPGPASSMGWAPDHLG